MRALQEQIIPSGEVETIDEVYLQDGQPVGALVSAIRAQMGDISTQLHVVKQTSGGELYNGEAYRINPDVFIRGMKAGSQFVDDALTEDLLSLPGLTRGIIFKRERGEPFPPSR